MKFLTIITLSLSVIVAAIDNADILSDPRGVSAAYLDDNGKVVKKNIPPKADDNNSKEKRSPEPGQNSYYENNDDILRQLRNNHAQSWCNDYCGAKPRTVTKTETTIKLSTKTNTATATKTAPTETTTVDVTATADQTTITVTATATYTVPFPGAEVTMRRRRHRGRGQPDYKLPSYLRGYAPQRISAACSSLFPTSTVVRTVTYTKVRTATATVTDTVTPHATVTTTVATTTPVSTVTTTTTTSVCPMATEGITGIAVTPPGSLHFPNAPQAWQCCKACFDTPGCVAWWSVKDSICAYGVNSPPNSGTPTDQCPNGKGDWTFFTGGSQDGTELGGPGPCAGTGS